MDCKHKGFPEEGTPQMVDAGPRRTSFNCYSAVSWDSAKAPKDGGVRQAVNHQNTKKLI